MTVIRHGRMAVLFLIQGSHQFSGTAESLPYLSPKKMLRVFVLLLALLTACHSSPTQATQPETTTRDPRPDGFYTTIDSGSLPQLMVPDSRLMPMISAHRGGRDIPGYPENSLAVFAYTLRQTPAMLECDVNVSADGVLLLMHDNSLDRTTTGTGRVQDQNWSEMKDLFLIDDRGQVTDYRIPTFAEALDYAQGKAILSVDVKRGVDFAQVIRMIEEKGMTDYVVVITYNVEDAELVHRLNPDLMISVSIRNLEEWERMRNSTVPTDRMVAFTGTRLSPKALFDTLHHHHIPAILGTLGNLDQRVAVRGDSLYLEYLDLGADILATDRPVEAGAILRPLREE